VILVSVKDRLHKKFQYHASLLLIAAAVQSFKNGSLALSDFLIQIIRVKKGTRL